MRHSADTMTVLLDWLSAIAFLGAESAAEFFIIDCAQATDFVMMPYSETTLLPLTDAKFLIIEPETLCFVV